MELRANLPEFTFKRNQAELKFKSIFVHDTGLSVEEAIEIAKDSAVRMGMGDKALLNVPELSYSVKMRGWQIIVQKRI